MTEPSGLEGRIAALEGQVRSLMATNWTDRASVVDANGNAVPLSGLAFGQVADLWPGVGVVDMSPTAGTASGSVTDPNQWTYMNPHPVVTVLVRGGRMRVDWSAQMAFLGGTAAANPYLAYSYRVIYTGPQNAPDTASVVVVQPDYYRALLLRDPSFSGNFAYLQAGNWAMHSGLTPGWYRVQGAWFLNYAATAGAQPHGYIDNPRIAATPF